MRHFICCMKSIDSYKRIVNCLTDDIEWEEYLTEIDQVQAKIAFINYDLAIIDEKLWWKDEAIDLFTKKSSEIIIFRGNFEDTINEIQKKSKKFDLQSTKEEIENKKEDETKEPEIKYVYINTPTKNEVPNNKKADKQIETIEKPIYISDIPKDYKKVVGITGICNSGKSLISVLCAAVIAKSNKIALIDMTENQNLYDHFVLTIDDKDKIQDLKPFKIFKNTDLYTKEYFKDKHVENFILELKQKYDLLIIDVGNNFSNSLVKILDNLYIVTDNDLTHPYEVRMYLKALKASGDIEKTKIIYNKMLNEKYIKTLNEITCNDVENNEIVYEGKLKTFFIKQVFDLKPYEKCLCFDVNVLKENEELLEQISEIANDMYFNKEYKTKNKIRGIFSKLRGKKKNEKNQ